MNEYVKEVEDKLGLTLTRKEILALPPKELKEYLFKSDSKEISEIADGGFRHKSGATMKDALQHWLKIGRCYGFATKDDSWGEFEKEFAIIIRRLVQAERVLKKLGVSDAWDYENGVTNQ